MFYIGSTNDVAAHIDCALGVPSCASEKKEWCRGSHNPYSNGAISMAWSPSVLGPWQEREILPYNPDHNLTEWNCVNNNPTAVELNNGTIMIVYRADPCAIGAEALGIAVADHWSKVFTRRKGFPIVSPADGSGNHEDPFLFQNHRGFHIITHDQSGGSVCGGSAFGSTCGAHVWSKDSYEWFVGKEAVYNSTVTFRDGSTNELKTRQRPQLVFEPGSSRPIALFNGGSFEGSNQDLGSLTHTFGFAFN